MEEDEDDGGGVRGGYTAGGQAALLSVVIIKLPFFALFSVEWSVSDDNYSDAEIAPGDLPMGSRDSVSLDP